MDRNEVRENYWQKLICLLFVILICIFCFSFKAVAKQSEMIEKLILSSKNCYPNYYFSENEIKKKVYQATYTDFGAIGFLKESQNLYLIPVNQCVMRGNKNYYKTENQQFLKTIKVKTIINTDFLAKSLVEGKLFGFNYLFTPIYPVSYLKGESVISLSNIFNNLSLMNKDERVYISCLDGKHKSSLISALIQFITEYANFPTKVCTKTNQALIWEQAELFANTKFGNYKMSSQYKKFYYDFCESVCKQKSEEFLSKL